MTQQKTEFRGQMAWGLSRLWRALYVNEPLRSARRIFLLSSVYCPLSFAADESRSAYTPPPPAVSSGSIMQIIFSLLLVLVAIVLVGWLLKRMNISQQGGGSHLKLLGGISIGQRERIVLVEVKDTWLVVGVGPGQIRTLHTLPKAEDEGQQTASAPSGASKFANLLSSFTKPQQTDTKQDAS